MARRSREEFGEEPEGRRVCARTGRHDIQMAVNEGERFIQSCREIRLTLETLAASCDEHATSQGKRKTGIGVVGVGAGVCIVLAPITGGTSLACAGALLSGTGAVAGVSHAIGSYRVNAENRNQLIEQVDRFQAAAESFEIVFQRAGEVRVEISAEEIARMGLGGVGAVAGTCSTLSALNDSAILLLNGGSYPIGNAAMTTNELIQAFQASGQVGVNIGRAGSAGSAGSAGASIASASMRGSSVAPQTTIAIAGGSASESIQLGGVAGRFAGEGAEAVGTGAGASAATKTFGVIGGVVGIAVGAWDIRAGIQQLTNEDATAVACRDLSTRIGTLRDQVSAQIAELRRILRMHIM